MATGAVTENRTPDPDVVRRFHFTREMVKGPVYRKYKFAIDAYEKFLTLAEKSDPERDRVKKAIIELKRRL